MKLARVIPRLAIVRANCNGSLPSGEPSSNPEYTEVFEGKK